MDVSRAALLAPFLACASLAVLAQAPATYGNLQVFAERAPLLRLDGTQAIAVITREQIAARQAVSVVELLREVAGLHVDRMGNAGGVTNLYIRGADPNHTVVLIDGVRTNDPTDVRGGSVDLSTLDVDAIERIEVLRGASSAQFGADAMGGIVNIVTRGTARERLRASLGYGGDGWRRASAGAASSVSALSVEAGASRGEDGRVEDGGTARDTRANAALEWRAAGAGTVAFTGRWVDSDRSAFPESSGGIRLAVGRDLERRQSRESSGVLEYRTLAGAAWSASAQASTFERREDRDTPAVAPGPGGFLPAAVSHTDFHRDGVLAQLSRSRLPLDATVVAGFEVTREEGDRRSILDLGEPVPGDFHLRRDNRAAYAQVELQAPAPLRWMAAVRHDAVDPGGSRTTHSAGARLALGASDAVRANWSEGFKPPSFTALGDPLVGNPELRPETSRNREIGWEHLGGTWRAQVTLFHSSYRDLVDFDPDLFRLVNRSASRARGAEAQASTAIDGTELAATYTYVDARLEDEGTPLRNRPRHRASVSAARGWGAWSFRAAAIYQGESLDFSIPTGEAAVPGFTVLDLSARWRAGPWSVSLAIDNATDRRYESFIGFTAPGARLRAAIGWKP